MIEINRDKIDFKIWYHNELKMYICEPLAGRDNGEPPNGYGHCAESALRSFLEFSEPSDKFYELGPEERVKGFRGPIFCGGGASTGAYVARLHELVDEGIKVLSGMQQNGLQGTKFDQESDNADRIRLKEIGKQISIALGCETVSECEK